MGDSEAVSRRGWFGRKKVVDEEKEKYAPVSYFQLFRYASLNDKLLSMLSVTAAIAHGSLLPVLTILFGRIVDKFGEITCPPDAPDCTPAADFSDTVAGIVNWFLIIAVIAFCLSFVQLSSALIVANRMGNEYRRRFFDSLMRQDCNFYDNSEAGSLTHIVISDIQLIQGGIGDKLATACQYLSTFVVGIIVGFAYGWKLTLLILGVTPALLISGSIFGNSAADATGDGLGAYAEAGGVATEVLSLIRTVTAFGGQEEEARRYEKSLDKASKASIKAAMSSGLGLGTAMFIIMGTYGLAFYVGANIARAGEMSAGDVLLTFFAITLGASSLGTAGPAFKSFATARAAAPRVFDVIEKKSPIDPLDDETGLVPDEPPSGRLTFENLDFIYPKRTMDDADNKLVLDNFNLEIPVGTSEAFVGKSGCGKSTIARLIQRCYDPVRGAVMLDGIDIRELNVRWLRSQIGVVSQMPSLFMMTIRENIALGAGVDIKRDPATGKIVATRRTVTDADIVEAAKKANAHSFITKLPEGYDTMLGERGAMLSGGQKQRVCIARALIRNPKVLILDESTAALDSVSEQIVQDALDKAAAGRTTVTIAHRLSTIKNSDKISCIQDGKVLERGSHDELISTEGGFYKNLFEIQRIEKEKMEEEQSDDEFDDVIMEQPFTPRSSVYSMSKTRATSVSKLSILEAGEDGGEDAGRPSVDKGLFLRTLRMNQSEMHLIFFGIIGAVLAGIMWPLASISLTELVEIMTFDNDPKDVRFWAISFLVLGVLSFVGNALQHGILGISGERLTRKLRALAFRSLLRQEMGYFDMEENSVGALTGRLSADAGAVKGLTGDLFGVGINILGSIVCGLVISFVNCWRLTLVVLAIIPGIALGGYFEMQASAGHDSGARKDFAKANAVAAEAVENIGTVRTLGVEDHFATGYNDMILKTRKSKLRKALITGAAFGFSEFSIFLIWYATFKAGADFVEAGQCTFKEMMVSSMALLFAAVTLGNVAVFAPDIGTSQIGATHVYRLLDRESRIDPVTNEGDHVPDLKGDITADKIYFEYPRRPDVPVLRGLTVDIARAKTLALVGASGHGKSTIISLLERYYSIRDGRLSVDDRDISGIAVQSLRSQIGIVSQEPELFNRSVFDNIAYGAGEGTPITMSDVVAAAKDANAHDFITALPDGYDTVVGPRGDALSGGQRQRIAIARSLVRKPPILLLDEATSALDNASQALVQEALGRASSGRTTIVVAHRLSTIRDADTIAVVRKGRIVESGTHDKLVRKNGYYAELMKHQLTDV